MNLIFLVEDGVWFFLSLLMTLFIFINVRRTLREAVQRNRAGISLNQPNRMLPVIIKSILFFLFYGFSLVATVSDNQTTPTGFINSVTATYCSEQKMSTGKDECNKYAVAFSIVTGSAFMLSKEIIAWNIFYGLYLFACYFYFNIQLGFATLIVLFTFKYFNNIDANFLVTFLLISLAVAVAYLFYKLKRRLLNAIRYAFARHGRSGIARFLEFYVICLPYFVFSLTLTALNIGYSNIVIQLILVHTFAYFTIFKLYREGCDIGFDYDPW